MFSKDDNQRYLLFLSFLSLLVCLFLWFSIKISGMEIGSKIRGIHENQEKILKKIIFRRFSCRISEENYSEDLFFRAITGNLPSLSPDYFPENLQAISPLYSSSKKNPQASILAGEAFTNLKALLLDARKEGIYLLVNSAFRSFEEQKNFYQKQGNNILGPAAAPGLSEHQLGTAVDLSFPGKNNLYRGYSWLEKHAPEYGFYLSYPERDGKIGEFPFEPWHYRYLGKEKTQDFLSREKNFNHSVDFFIQTNGKFFRHHLASDYFGIFLQDSTGNFREILDISFLENYSQKDLAEEIKSLWPEIQKWKFRKTEKDNQATGLNSYFYYFYYPRADSVLVFVHLEKKDYLSRGIVKNFLSSLCVNF